MMVPFNRLAVAGSSIMVIFSVAGAAHASAPPLPTLAPPLFYGDAVAAVHYGSFVVAGDHHSFRGALPGSTGAVTYTSGQATSSVGVTGDQHLSAESHAFADAATPGLSFYATASGVLRYFVAIVGAQNILVPLHLMGSLSTYSSPSFDGSYGLANADFSLQGQNNISSGSQFQRSSCSSGLEATCGTTKFQIDFDAFAFSNASNGNMLQIFIDVVADAKAMSFDTGGGVYSAGTAQILALADPTITIDANWSANHPGYAIEVSQNVVNGAAAVPEPTSWGLMVGGFGLLGVALRRSRWDEAVDALG
jgi:hypothetical protein